MNEKVTIVGAGNQGLAVAAYLSINNVECYLYNRTRDNSISMETDKNKKRGKEL